MARVTRCSVWPLNSDELAVKMNGGVEAWDSRGGNPRDNESFGCMARTIVADEVESTWLCQPLPPVAIEQASLVAGNIYRQHSREHRVALGGRKVDIVPASHEHGMVVIDGPVQVQPKG